jgi:UPF0755 protein
MKRAVSVLLALGAGLPLAGSVWCWREWESPYQGYTGSVILEITPRTASYQIARLLEERGVLRSRWPFWLRHVAARGQTLKAGEYAFDRPLRPREVYLKLVRGDVLLYSVTIPEGSDRFDMARIVERDLKIDAQAFLRATQNGAAIQDLDPQADTLEGYLFPETYHFPRGATADQVVAAMLGQFRRVWAALLPAGANPPVREVITLASLVEKETPAASERPLVAGVFQNRLRRGIPLQCDPTVIYAARIAGRNIGPIKQSDLNFDSPYNTYRRAGLPPGPIASPGEAAIRAALEPEETAFLYFVSNDQGGHYFSKTLAEHNQKVARYRREVALRRRAEQAASPGNSGPNSRKAIETESR